MAKTNKNIRFANSTFVQIDQLTATTEAQLTALLNQFVAPANVAALQDALFDLKLDLIQATVTAAGLTWKDS